MKNKTLWTDTNGSAIQAHGGMILQHEGMYYWYGENKDTETINRHVDFIGISCYSSSDLEHWDNEGIVLAPMSQDPGHMLHTTKICERPRVFTISTQSNSSCTRTQIQVIIFMQASMWLFHHPQRGRFNI
ncbi:hypothetical protein MKA46_16870 [[Clostridium] innocuum]|nr:hypothetical protein [[Clostridium] innocuum]